MLKDRGHKGSWKGSASSQRTKKKSYGNIHSINDRGIHEIHEMLGGVANGPGGSGGGPGTSPASVGGLVAPAPGDGTAGGGGGGGVGSVPVSPWSSPLMGRKSMINAATVGSGGGGNSSVIGSPATSDKAASEHQRMMALGPTLSAGGPGGQ